MAQKSKERNIREDFLKVFLSSLIKNSYTPETQIIKPIVTELKPKQETLIEIESPQIQNQIPLQNKIIQNRPRSLQPPRSQFPQFPRRNIPPQMLNLQDQQKFIPQLPPPTNNQVTINLGKITQIISDPTVLGVECPGAGKNIMANRSGAIQTTAITLTKEEIDYLMQEISEKTRIPVIPGIFKAAINDLVITAVISEFVGTRFVIQKRTPFTRY